MMHPYLNALQTLFEANADEENAAAMAKYMRDQFPFLGIKSPSRKTLTKEFVTEHGLPELADLEEIVRDLWLLPEREYQYVALDLLERMRRRLTADFIHLFEHLIITKSWWDTIDAIASHQVGDLFLRFPEIRDETIGRWRNSNNFWLRRVTLLFQLRYKDKTDVDLLFALIEENLGSAEFFINKAIGWALREYSKRDAAAVREFVAQTPLELLSEREALKWLQRKKQDDAI